MTMNENTPNTPLPAAEPVKKPQWYRHVSNVFSILCLLWFLGGIKVLLLQDISLLLFVLCWVALYWLPVLRWKVSPPKTYRDYAVCFLWAFVSIVLMYLVQLFIIPPFAISPQTTYLTEPRAKDYYGIDYQAAIIQELDPGVLPEDNGFRPLIETFGRTLFAENLKDKHWIQLCHYLDLDPNLKPKAAFTDAWTLIESLPPEERERAEIRYREGTFPICDNVISIMQPWIDENELALELFAETAPKPVLFLPPLFESTDTLFFVHINNTMARIMVRNMNVRVHYYLEKNETEKAWNDVLTIFRLVKHQHQAAWDWPSLYTNRWMLGNANRAAFAVLSHAAWSAEEIRRRAEEILPFQEPFDDIEMKKILRNERLNMLDICQHLYFTSIDIHWFSRWYFQTLYRRGYMMAEINRLYDKREKICFSKLPKPADVTDYDGKEHLESNTIRSFLWYGFTAAPPTEMAWYIDFHYHVSAYTLRDTVSSAQAESLLLQLAFALESYRRDHGGEFPDKLDDLRERYLAEIPLDPFSGKPFRYVVKPATDDEPANVLLYSVGPNGIDEEGRDGKDEDDICRRFVKE